jgi:hypothetical protein
LSEPELAEAWAKGRSLSEDDTVDCALAVD